LFELFVRVVTVFDVLGWRKQQPLADIRDVDVEGVVGLLDTLGMFRRLVARAEDASDLDREIVRTLRRVRSDDGDAGEKLTRGQIVVLVEEAHVFVACIIPYGVFFNSMIARFMSSNNFADPKNFSKNCLPDNSTSPFIGRLS